MTQLSAEIEAYIQAQLAAGTFQSREQLLEKAIGLMQQREADRQFIAREVNRGIEEVARGSTESGDDVLARLEEHAKSLAKGNSPE